MANIEFGRVLRNLRKRNNYTQQQVADKLGLKNKSTLGSWEVGKSEPDAFTLLKLCKLYGVSDIYKTFNTDSPNTDNRESAVLDNFNKLNDSGKDRLLETSEELIQLEKYKK